MAYYRTNTWQKDELLEHPEDYGGYTATNITMVAQCPNPRFGGVYYSDTDQGTDRWWYHGHCATCGRVFDSQGASAEQNVKNACNSAHTYNKTVQGTVVVFPLEAET